jgi:hypothetical protein
MDGQHTFETQKGILLCEVTLSFEVSALTPHH